MGTLTIELAGCRYRVAGMTPGQLALVRSRFDALLCRDDGGSDVAIDVHYRPNPAGVMQRPRGPAEYRVGVTYDRDSISAAGIGFTANIDRQPLRAQLHTCLDDAWFVGAFENLFRVVASYRLFAEGGLVMHSAAFTDADRGFLFCGRSGAGKTTLCGLAEELELGILSDELNAIVPQDGSFSILAMPFAGDFGATPKRHPPYPLTALMGLAHAPSPEVRGCSKGVAVSRIVASCPYVNADPLLIDELTARAVALVARAPLRVLHFAKNPTFWHLLDHEYRSLDQPISP